MFLYYFDNNVEKCLTAPPCGLESLQQVSPHTGITPAVVSPIKSPKGFIFLSVSVFERLITSLVSPFLHQSSDPQGQCLLAPQTPLPTYKHRFDEFKKLFKELPESEILIAGELQEFLLESPCFRFMFLFKLMVFFAEVHWAFVFFLLAKVEIPLKTLHYRNPFEGEEIFNAVQYSAGKPCTLLVMWKPLDTNHPPKNALADQTHPLMVQSFQLEHWTVATSAISGCIVVADQCMH